MPTSLAMPSSPAMTCADRAGSDQDGWGRTRRRVAPLLEAAAIAGSGLTPAWLAAAVAELALDCPAWEDLTGEVPAARTYRRLGASPHLEAWLICWPRDTHLQLHDHGGASGAFQVVRGCLDERWLVRGDGEPFGGNGARLARRVLAAGERSSFDGAYIHDVRNVEAAPATSVHVYGPAERAMAFYRLDGGVARSVGPASEQALRQGERDAALSGCTGPVSTP